MKKLLLMWIMLLGMGGVISVNAVTLKATFDTPAANASWDEATNTYTWTASTNNLMTMFTFPNGELKMYSKIHLEVAQDSHQNFRFCLMNGGEPLGEVVCWSSGTKDITFSEHANTKDVDLSQVTHIAFGGSANPAAGNSYSCVLTNVYLEGPAAGYEAEYRAGTPLSLESVVSGNTLVSIGGTDNTILYGTHQDNQIYAEAINTAMEKVTNAGSNSSTYRFRITQATDDGLVLPAGVTTLYRIQAFKGEGTTIYTGPWYGGNCYLNDIGWTRNVVPQGDQEGEKGCFFGLSPVEGKENTYKITSYRLDGTVFSDNIFGKSEWIFYELEENIVPEKRVVEANDEIFAINNFVDGKWTLDEPTNLYDWNYLVIATENTAANESHRITLRDKNGTSIGGDDYKGDALGTGAVTGAGMWLDRWNSQNIIAIDLNAVRINYGLDIFNIASLEIGGDIKPSVVYLTDYANPKITNRGRWTLYVDGDLIRNYKQADLGKFGTICLPYKASYTGAEIYSIVNKTSNSITLEKVTGLMEAGKPYFYKAVDAVGQDNRAEGKDVHNVHFFRADLDTYDAATPIANNGLIGTFTGTTALQGENYYVLSGNKLYDTVGSTVNVGANKAYIDMSLVENQSSEAKNRISIDFGNAEATGIESVNDTKVLNSGKMYDLSGREVTNPTSGIYIMDGKKIIIK